MLGLLSPSISAWKGSIPWGNEKWESMECVGTLTFLIYTVSLYARTGINRGDGTECFWWRETVDFSDIPNTAIFKPASTVSMNYSRKQQQTFRGGESVKVFEIDVQMLGGSPTLYPLRVLV